MKFYILISIILPITDPRLAIEMTYETSCRLNDPVGNVLFFSWSSFELIDGHANVVVAENINKSPTIPADYSF